MEDTKERYLDVSQLAEFLQVPKSWIYQRTSAGDIPCVRVGKYLRFWLPAVIAWLEGINGKMMA